MSFGAVQHAISVMKSNRNLIKKHRKKGGLKGHFGLEKTEYNLPKASPKQLSELRNKLKSEKRLRNLKIYLFVGVITSAIIGVLVYYA
ncbi:hypothetical protein [Aurantibacter aestuarii]|uniref:Uncharacterized protein n=1 Tax=Aurantibacter aestuarii TaxID=1266046 RepID=A0A2T1NE84_9FLAO|nr:hypothetical protein [Aurantibacter aestuarii]PSG90754.1 hypothetical protein C7H52_05630 [Aurantibacter aestuarii]